MRKRQRFQNRWLWRWLRGFRLSLLRLVLGILAMENLFVWWIFWISIKRFNFPFKIGLSLNLGLLDLNFDCFCFLSLLFKYFHHILFYSWAIQSLIYLILLMIFLVIILFLYLVIALLTSYYFLWKEYLRARVSR